MPSPAGSILRAASRGDDEPLRVLTFPTHERFQSGLGGCNATFYLIQAPGLKDWKAHYAPLPKNHILLDGSKGDQQLPPEIDFDLVFSQNRLAHGQMARTLADKLHLPMLHLEHTLPPPGWAPSHFAQYRSIRADVDAFISEFSRKAWGYEEKGLVVRHGVDTDVFRPGDGDSPRENVALSVCNDWVNRDWACGYTFWQEATAGLPRQVLGDTPGLSKPAKDVPDLVAHYQRASIFVNTSLVSPIPMALMEAMACGCCVVSTATAMIPEVVEHEKNGLLADNPRDMRLLIQKALGRPDWARELGAAARQTMLERFSLGRFVRDWDRVFQQAANFVYRG